MPERLSGNGNQVNSVRTDEVRTELGIKDGSEAQKVGANSHSTPKPVNRDALSDEVFRGKIALANFSRT